MAYTTVISVSQFWRLEVRGQGVSRVGFFSLLIDGHLLSLSLPGLSSVRDCVPVSPYYKGAGQVGLEPTHMTLLNYFFKVDLQIQQRSELLGDQDF